MVIERRGSRLRLGVQEELIKYFCAGVTARAAAEVSGVNRNTAILFCHKLREVIFAALEAEAPELLTGEIEVDESYFGGHRKGKRGRGAIGKVPVFGLLKRQGKVYVAIIANARSLSADLRLRRVQAIEEGRSARSAAARFDVSGSAAIKLMQRFRSTGSATPAKVDGYRKPLLAGHNDLLRELTATHKGISLAEIREELLTRGIEPNCPRTIWTRLRHLGLSHKKTIRAAEQDRADVAKHRRQWRIWQRYMDTTAFVFLDERQALDRSFGG